MKFFLRRRKVLDYELFEQQAINNNKTYAYRRHSSPIRQDIKTYGSIFL
jgi:hypothetical protein